MNRKLFLKELERHGEKNHIPNISSSNAQYLRNILREKGYKNILEIGSANGYSTIHFADELEKHLWWWKITSIEFSQLAYEDAQENFTKAEVDSLIEHYFWDAREIIPLLEEIYDFIFIDGLKKASLSFLQLCLPKLAPWGTIVIDDVIKFRHKMKDLYEYLENSDLHYEVIQIDEDDGIMRIEV